jgi:ferredoxin-NADP reductase
MRLTLVEKKQETEFSFSFLFKPDIPFSWKSGQFLHYILKHSNPDNRGTERYFTISSAFFENIIMLTTRFIESGGSSFKKTLISLNYGDTIDATVPDGNFTIDNTEKEMVFIAGGIGITPFRSMLLDLDHRNIFPKIILLYANKTADFIFKKDLERISGRNRNFKINYLVDPQRIDEEKIKQAIPNLEQPIFYISGPEPMVNNINVMLQQQRIPENHIKKDFFPGYSG